MNIVSFVENFFSNLSSKRLRFFALMCALTTISVAATAFSILRSDAQGPRYAIVILAVFLPSVALFLAFSVKMYRNVMNYLTYGRVDALALAFTYALCFLAQFYMTLLTCSRVAFG